MAMKSSGLFNGDHLQNQISQTADVRLVQMSLLFTDHPPRVPARPQDRGAQACEKRTVKCSPGESFTLKSRFETTYETWVECWVMKCLLHQVIWFDLLHQVKAKLYPPPKEEDFLWRVEVIPHLSYIATIHSQKLIMKLFPPFTKLIFYHHIITFPPRKIPTIVTQVFGSIDSRQSPSIDSKLQWGNQAVHQIQLQKAVSQRGRGIFSIFYSILHILPWGWIHLFSRLVQWPSVILERHTWLPSAGYC